MFDKIMVALDTHEICVHLFNQAITSLIKLEVTLTAVDQTTLSVACKKPVAHKRRDYE